MNKTTKDFSNLKTCLTDRFNNTINSEKNILNGFTTER